MTEARTRANAVAGIVNRRPRYRRLWDLATSIYIYLIAVNMGGDHAQRAVRDHANQRPAPLPTVIQDAKLQRDFWHGRLGSTGPASMHAIMTSVNDEGKQLVVRLRQHTQHLHADQIDPRKFDDAIHVAEAVRAIGEQLVNAPASERVGATLLFMAYDVEWSVATFLPALAARSGHDPAAGAHTQAH